MFKTFEGYNKYSKKNGFTLVELLAVIVILAIIMLIAIPSVFSALETARKRSILTYTEKVVGLAYEQRMRQDLLSEEELEDCVIYDVKNDLGLTETGNYNGWILLDEENDKAYVTLFDDTYAIVAFQYNYSTLNIFEHLVLKSSINPEDLTKEALCSHSTCKTCSIYNKETDDTDDIEDIPDSPKPIDDTPNPSDEKEEIINPTYLVKGSEFNELIKKLMDGNTITSFKKSTELPVNVPSIEASDPDSPVKLWLYVDGDTIYYYNESKGKIVLDEDSSSLFKGCSSLISIDLTGFDTSNVKSFEYMFGNCSSLKSLDLSEWDTSNATSMYKMFRGCSSLEELNVKNFDTSNVTLLAGMFQDCSSLKTIDVSNFNTSKVTIMFDLFFGCSSLETLDVSNFDTKRVTDFNNMFQSCEKLKTLDLSNFDTRNALYMGYMFSECTSLERLDLSNFNTSKVENMIGMFHYCKKLKYLDISNFDTSNVTNISNIFYRDVSLETLKISEFDLSKITDKDNKKNMFYKVPSSVIPSWYKG